MEVFTNKVRIFRQVFKDTDLLYIHYYSTDDVDYEKIEDFEEISTVVLNQNNDDKLNHFLISYILTKKELGKLEGYERLYVFDNFDNEICNKAVRKMLPDNFALFRYIDRDTASELSDKYMIPKSLLLSHIQKKERA